MAHCRVLLGAPDALEFGIQASADAQGKLSIPATSLTPAGTLYALAITGGSRVLWLCHPLERTAADRGSEIVLRFPPEAEVTIILEPQNDGRVHPGGQVRMVVLPQDDGPASEAFLELAGRLNPIAATPDENGRCPELRLAVGLELRVDSFAVAGDHAPWTHSSETMPPGILAGSFRVTTPGPHKVRIRRVATITLRIRLVDERGAVIPACSLVFQHLDLGSGREAIHTAAMRTDERGEATLQIPVAPGSGEPAMGPWTWWAMVDREGKGRACVQGRTQGDDRSIEITLVSVPAEEALRGRILSILDGAPLKDVPLHVRLGGVTLGKFRSDGEGHFVVPAALVPPADWLNSRPVGEREFRVFLDTPLIGHTRRWARGAKVDLPDFLRGIPIRGNEFLTIQLHPGPAR